MWELIDEFAILIQMLDVMETMDYFHSLEKLSLSDTCIRVNTLKVLCTSLLTHCKKKKVHFFILLCWIGLFHISLLDQTRREDLHQALSKKYVKCEHIHTWSDVRLVFHSLFLDK